MTQPSKIKNLDDLMAAETPAWIWKGVLLPSGLTLLSAFPKVGKTTFVYHMLRAMWTQDTYMGLDIRPAPTLVVTEEADTLLAARCEALGFSSMWPIGFLTPEPGRTWEQIMAYIRKYAMTYHNPVIIIDTLSRHWGIDDENDNAKVEKVMGPLIATARSSGASMLLVHHTRKSGGFGGTASRGGSAIVGAVDVIVELNRYSKDDKSNRRRIDSYSRYAETPGVEESLIIELGDNGYTVAGHEASGSSESASEKRIYDWLLANDGWWQISAIAAASHTPERTVRDALETLCAFPAERVRMKGSGKRGSPTLYSAQEETLEDDDVASIR